MKNFYSSCSSTVFAERAWHGRLPLRGSAVQKRDIAQ